MVTLNDITDAIVAQLEDAFSTASDRPDAIHIEGDMFAVAETPYITIFPSSDNGLVGGFAAHGELTPAIPLIVGVRTGSAASVEANRLLKRFMDDTDELSVLAALDSDPSLGGVADTIGWGDGWPWSGFSSFPSGDGELVGSNLAIVVVKAHS